jgi:hypothetical protein
MSLLVLWIVTPGGLVDRYQCFRGTLCLYLQGWTEDEGTMILQKSTRRYNPEYQHRQNITYFDIQVGRLRSMKKLLKWFLNPKELFMPVGLSIWLKRIMVKTVWIRIIVTLHKIRPYACRQYSEHIEWPSEIIIRRDLKQCDKIITEFSWNVSWTENMASNGAHTSYKCAFSDFLSFLSLSINLGNWKVFKIKVVERNEVYIIHQCFIWWVVFWGNW